MTASLVARDPTTGEMGIVVVGTMMNAGALVPAAQAGVGVVASQHSPESSYGPLGLELMKGGLSAGDALKALLAVDEARERRQVLLLDSDGGVAVHTGALCVPQRNDRAGPEVCAASSSLALPVADVLVDAFLSFEGDLTARLMFAASRVAGAEGAMEKTARSAALLVVGGAMTGRPWEDVVWDLRVDEHRTPVAELARLVKLKRGFRRMFVATGKAMLGDPEAGLEVFSELENEHADHLDFAARKAMLLAMVGRIDEARALCAKLTADGAGWRDLFERYTAAKMMPEGLVDALFGEVADDEEA